MDIHPNIASSHTLPGEFYSSQESFARSRERIFLRSWQFIGEAGMVKIPGQVHPFTFMEGLLDEPLLLTRDKDDRLHCLSNVCTHRGNILCSGPAQKQELKCSYHGRRFALDGTFLQMPETDGMQDFPSERDNLPRVALKQWGPFLFASLHPQVDFDALMAPMQERVGWLPLQEFVHDPNRSRDYLVKANWALYCDNYLEGFHIPYIHKDLARELDYGSYSTELFTWSSLQVGVARGGGSSFDLPDSSPDHGQSIAAYYFWLFPNTMFNFYPWGLSVNIVRPLVPDRTKVIFRSYIWDESKIDRGAGALLDRVEREDEHMVEQVQAGTRARLYGRGRFSPRMERGVHHFHTLIAGFLNGEA